RQRCYWWTCIEPRRPLPVTPKNIVEVGLIKGLRRVAENETFGGAKIFAYRTGPQPSTPRFRLRSSAVERALSSKRPQLAGALHLHFAGKLPALPGRRSAWPFGHSHCKSPQSSRKPHGGMNRDSGRNPCHPRSLSFVARHACGSRHPDSASVSSANGAS